MEDREGEFLRREGEERRARSVATSGRVVNYSGVRILLSLHPSLPSLQPSPQLVTRLSELTQIFSTLVNRFIPITKAGNSKFRG